MVLPLAPTSLGDKWPSPSHPAAPHHKAVLSSSSAQEAQKPLREAPLPLPPSLPPTPLLLTGLLTTLGSFQRRWPHRHSLGGVFPVGPEAPTLLFSSDGPGAALLPSFGSWDQHSLFPKAFLLLTHCSPQLALYTTSELTSSLPACFPAGFTRVGQQSHGLS